MKLFLIFFLLSIQAFAQTSYVPVTHLLKKSGTQLSLGADYFMTSKTVDKDGKSNSLADGQSFSRIQSQAGVLYGVTDELQFSGGVRYRQNRAQFIDLNSQEQNESSSGVQSTYIGMSYAFPKVDRLQYTFEGQFSFTPYTNQDHSTANPGQMILGDDGNEYFGGLGVTYSSLGNNYLTARGGYRRPGKDLSAEIYLNLEGALAWRHFALIAGVDGNVSSKNDPYAGDLTGRPARNTGGSEFYNSTNREWITPYAGLNFTMGKLWRVELKASQVVSGTSTDLGTGFGINLIRRVDKIQPRKADKAFKSYDVEAYVTKVSPKKEFVVIDKGLTSDISNGMRFDLFENDFLGGNVLVAAGIVIQIKADTAIIKITQRYNLKKDLKEGLLARALIK